MPHDTAKLREGFFCRGPSLVYWPSRGGSRLARLRWLVIVLALFAATASAQPYPSRPIRFIVPLAPVGGTDFVTRLIAQRLTEAFGQQVVVDNRPGGNGIISGEIVAKAVPDGYTLLMVTPSFVTNPALFKKMPFDTLK